MRSVPYSALLRQGRTLEKNDVWILVQISTILAALALCQRMLSLPTLVKLFDVTSPPRPKSPMAPERLIQLTRGLLGQNIGLFRPNCLKQSFVLFHFLRKWGYPVRIHFGVRKQASELAGHCWLDLNGTPIFERADPEEVFKVIYSFPCPEEEDRGSSK